ncbi:hypothetical protein ACWDOP_35820 [Nocardia sp. NPDC003693]
MVTQPDGPGALESSSRIWEDAIAMITGTGRLKCEDPGSAQLAEATKMIGLHQDCGDSCMVALRARQALGTNVLSARVGGVE